MPLVMMVGPGRAVRTVVIFMLLRRGCVMLSVLITTMLDLDTGGHLITLNHQQPPSEPGENTEHQKPCRNSKHAAKKHRSP